MRKQKMSIAQKICFAVGIALIVSAALLTILWQYNVNSSAKQAGMRVEAIYSIIPEARGAVLEERRDNKMTVLSLDGTDFLGVLEMPRYDSALPVGAEWGKIDKYPCCFDGSIYDGSLQIGATTQKGQFDFYRDISVGDAVCLTDMEGNRFTLTVTELRYEKNADEAALLREKAQLTLFIKNVYAFEYLIVYCNVSD